MEIKRIALIFDTRLRPETAGVHCQRALERLAEVRHFQPHELDQVRRGEFDLFFNIDDGLHYHLPPALRPSAFWAIDTHLNFERCRDKAPRFDIVFAAQRDGVDLHNLGTLFMRSRRHDEAVVAYGQSLRYRPNYPATYLNLGYALQG
jgi:O-antigen biosynthesis protein